MNYDAKLLTAIFQSFTAVLPVFSFCCSFPVCMTLNSMSSFPSSWMRSASTTSWCSISGFSRVSRQVFKFLLQVFDSFHFGSMSSQFQTFVSSFFSCWVSVLHSFISSVFHFFFDFPFLTLLVMEVLRWLACSFKFSFNFQDAVRLHFRAVLAPVFAPVLVAWPFELGQ